MDPFSETSIKCSLFVTLPSSSNMSSKVIVFFALLAVAFAKRPYVGLRLPSLSLGPFSPQIIGGSEAKIGDFPFMVSLQWGPSTSSMQHFCAGSILNAQWILTAGHCVQAIPPGIGIFLVKAGKHNILKTESTEQAIEVERSYVHEKYGGDVGPYDIGLLKLKEPLKLTKEVQLIDLPPAESDPNGDATLCGWGSISPSGFEMPDKLQHIGLPYVDRQTCYEAVLRLTGSSPVHETNVCTGPLSGGISACSGDSGGPLTSKINGKKVVTGIVSWGIIPCGTVGAPSVYTRVSIFISWIQQIIRNN